VFRANINSNDDDPEMIRSGLDDLQAITVYDPSVKPDDQVVLLYYLSRTISFA